LLDITVLLLYNRVMESILDRSIVLSLNANWQAIKELTVRKALEDMTSESIHGDAPKLGINVVWEDDGINVAYYEAVSWEKWITLPIRSGDLVVQTHHFQIKAPTVIICKNYHKTHIKTPHLNASSIFARDGYRCQYCGNVFPRKQLNMDHVIPQDKRYGGKTTWENVVCSCIKCNTRKANRLPHEAGMKLIRKPVAPKSTPVTFDFRFAKHRDWKPFLY
jgi:5-methylcytosine-specific restriction endonuclease McrA